jgi:predicted N-acetyltransferase YhbS
MPAAPAGLRLVPARTGDHPLIHRLLLSVFHGPSAAEFHAQIDEPGYLPSDRLVVKDRDQIAAHLRLARQTIHLGPATLPAARFMDLATAPEFRSRGFATSLLSAGLREARAAGALVALTRTAAPELFARQGWAVCGKHTFSSAPPRAVLAELGAATAPLDEVSALAAGLRGPRQEPIFVRPLRRIELPAAVRLYRDESRRHNGWPVRSESYFEWLLARGACDRIYVAATCPETGDIKRLLDSIVGYAFVRQCRIVELVTAEGRDDVPRELAARACADASEEDGWQIRCDAPAGHPLHELFRRASGKLTCDQQLGGEVFMARLLDPLAVLRQTARVLAERAASAGLAPGVELGIELRGGSVDLSGKQPGTSAAREQPLRGVVERYRLQLRGEGIHVETGGPLKHTVVLRASDLAPLLLGEASAEDMLAIGRLRAATRTGRQLATALFPNACWWRPPLDDLLA